MVLRSFSKPLQLPPVSKLVGDKIEGHLKWSSCVVGADDCIYGIPCQARRVAKFDPTNHSLIEIGPDLGTDIWKWNGGVLAGDGCIYCLRSGNPSGSILKIDTFNCVVTIIDILLPESGNMLWATGALGPDGYIYYMPAHALRILKFNPQDETVESVGDEVIGFGWKYISTIVGKDGYLYGIPNEAKKILRLNAVFNQHISYIGPEANDSIRCRGRGALGRDGHIYAINHDGQVLKVDTVNDEYSIIGRKIKMGSYAKEWGDAILGNDGCVYWPPSKAIYTLKFDPVSKVVSQVGGEFEDTISKWSCGASASDCVIYCLPTNHSHVLTIDPFNEFVTTLKSNLRILRGRNFGGLFMRDKHGETGYESAVRKFGVNKVTKVVEKYAPKTGLPLFAIAASSDNGATSIIYHFLRDDPSLISGLS